MGSPLVIGQITAGDSIVTLVSFLLLMLALKKVAWKPLMAMMEKREQLVARNIDDAEAKKLDAERLLKEQQQQLEDTRNNSSAVIEKARDSADKMEREQLAAAKVEIARLKEEARKAIELERKQALLSAQNDISRLSLDIAEKLIGKELSNEGHAELIEEYIERLANNNEVK
ncbi:ATP synthase F0 subcomplex B subunit [Carnobacterium alterfunditum]|uniref:ATP synthase subunit b n=1 Tax=Carnobacterium alterfunditum TaxID=28230 RepID=A0A1N6HS36_9LACT|nr:F0F1 ATP synthase subunit B [Carnobacterium alterfunditum]SIO22546.1 ATP synthase F0 subcomplex B subunit [Carnobacterium alterfunditum]